MLDCHPCDLDVSDAANFPDLPDQACWEDRVVLAYQSYQPEVGVR